LLPRIFYTSLVKRIQEEIAMKEETPELRKEFVAAVETIAKSIAPDGPCIAGTCSPGLATCGPGTCAGGAYLIT
jgi:hypothetical protein